MQMIIDPGSGVRNTHHVKEGSLLDFFIGVKICLKAWKYPFSHGGEKLGIIAGGEKDNFRIKNHFSLRRGIVHEIGSDPEGENFRDAFKSASESNKSGIREGHAHLQRICALMARPLVSTWFTLPLKAWSYGTVEASR